MRSDCEHYLREVVLGRRHGAGAAALRVGLQLAKPFYAVPVALRNWMYDAHLLRVYRTSIPVVCVGNLTTGGTGKTPVVRWLADALRRMGHRPAVLMRGYAPNSQHGSDEQRLLSRLLDDPSHPLIPVITEPDRVAGAKLAARSDERVDVLVLDDGFQHRRLHRDFDLVLIDASNPFGGGHLLPRGMLREPLRGLRRAFAILLTHVEAVSSDDLSTIEHDLRKHNSWAPLYTCRHVPGIVNPPDATVFAFCGIGNPESFIAELKRRGSLLLGSQYFADHHAYTARDLAALDQRAQMFGADVMLTTEKDWVKIESLVARHPTQTPIQPVRLDIEFENDDGSRLLQQIGSVISAAHSPGLTQAAGAD